MVSGMQEKDAQGHPKMLAYLKHFTAYSVETNRGHDSYNISLHDLHETYLAQYELAAPSVGRLGCHVLLQCGQRSAELRQRLRAQHAAQGQMAA